MTEKQIIEEIIRYIQDKAYNYAVLIDGEWGSGKTYFVNNTLTPEIEDQEKKSNTHRAVKYISLYGCKNMTDVQENIAWSFAENAREKIKDKANWGKTGDKISGNILLSSKKIGNAILKKFLPEGSLYEITSDWLNLGSFIFVFDDLERCDCPINEVFGFLNELVEHENTKVIIIANEKEISGVADTQYLELQYQLTLDGRIEWPEQERRDRWTSNNQNSRPISLNEMERRRKLLFPDKEANTVYRRIREKLIGVTLKYEPDIPQIIDKIIEASGYDDFTKEKLKKGKETFTSVMRYYHHNNLRTFQFFLSKVSYLIEKLENAGIDEEYNEVISDHIVLESFNQAVKFKSNYQPPRDNRTWLITEQETKFQSIKTYIEFGTYNHDGFIQDALNLQNELKARISKDDPYYVLYQQYYFHTQEWCEEQLEILLQQLSVNKYPISFYEKIIVAIQRLVDLGFSRNYMDRAKTAMITNVSNMGEISTIVPDLWYVDNLKFKEKILAVIADINDAINSHVENAGRETVIDILSHDNWIERLNNYTNPNGDRYIQDTIVFSKASSECWVNALHRATPEEIDDFRHWLNTIYPRNTIRNSYSVDAETIKSIIKGLEELKESKEDDLIKKASLGWLSSQFEAIVEFHEPKEEQAEEET